MTVRDRDAPHLWAVVGGTVVEAGLTTRGVTWLTADAPGSGAWRCAISPLPDFPLAATFPMVVGEFGFGGALYVRTNDAPLARVWLDSFVRRRLRATHGFHFTVEDGVVRGFTALTDADPERLVGAVRAVAALANRGTRIRARWHDIANALGGSLRGNTAGPSVSIDVPLSGAMLTIDAFAGGLAPRRPERGLFVRLQCQRRGMTDWFAMSDAGGRSAFAPVLPEAASRILTGIGDIDGRYDLWATRPSRVAQRLVAPRAEQALAAARPQVVFADARSLTIFFLGFEVAPRRLRAAVDLAEELVAGEGATGLLGPYR